MSRTTPPGSPRQSVAGRGYWFRVATLLAIPAALMVVPTRVIEAGPRLCLSQLILRRTCPGCGVTRAVSCVMHGELRRAYEYNPRVVAVFPLLVWLWLSEIRRLATTL
jgi:hypothetical protein